MVISDRELIEKEIQLVRELAGVGSDEIEIDDKGWTSGVYVISGGKYVFKFPRTQEVKKEYIQEIKIYNLLEKLDAHLQVPKVRWTHTENDYFGYEGIIGTQFATSVTNLRDEHKQNLGKDIGKFLRELHSREIEDPYIMKVEDEILQAQENYRVCLSVLKASFSPKEIIVLDRFINHYMPKKMLKLGGNSVLCHGDLGYWNMILKADGSLGIIDFGDVGFYDASKDFCGLQDEIMLNSALDAYGDNMILRDKIKIRQNYIPFFDLKYFAECKDRHKIEETLMTIKTYLL